MEGMISDLLKSQKRTYYLRERICYSWLGFFLITIFLAIGIRWLPIGIFEIKKIKIDYRIILFLLTFGLRLIKFLYINYIYIQRNKLNKNGHPKKTGIVIVIDDKGEFEGFKMKQDFLYELEKRLDNKIFEIIRLTNRKARLLNKCSNEKRKEMMKNLNNTINGHYRIYGFIDKQKDGKDKYFINTGAAVFHLEVPEAIKKELKLDFDNLYPKDISFDEDRYRSGLIFSSEYSIIVAKYIIGEASFISGNPLLAWELHENLHIEFKNILNIKEKEYVETKINKKYIDFIGEKIKLAQYEELSIICRYFYSNQKYKERLEWLMKRELLSNVYGFKDYNLLNNQAIYEFLINKNTSKSKKLLEEAAKTKKSPEIRYSKVFLDIRDKNYNEAGKTIERIIKKDFKDEIKMIDSVQVFLDEIIKNHSDRFEFLYRQALIYFKKSKDFPLALSKIEEYIKKSGNQKFGYEILSPQILKIKIERAMEIKQF